MADQTVRSAFASPGQPEGRKSASSSSSRRLQIIETVNDVVAQCQELEIDPDVKSVEKFFTEYRDDWKHKEEVLLQIEELKLEIRDLEAKYSSIPLTSDTLQSIQGTLHNVKFIRQEDEHSYKTMVRDYKLKKHGKDEDAPASIGPMAVKPIKRKTSAFVSGSSKQHRRNAMNSDDSEAEF